MTGCRETSEIQTKSNQRRFAHVPAQEQSNSKFLLAHPGGPLFARKDDGIWTIPKGEAAPGEDLLTRAQIEFEEEVGFRPEGVLDWIALGWIKQKGRQNCACLGIRRRFARIIRAANQICSKWNGHRVPESARCFQRLIRRAFFLKKLRDAKSSRRRCLFLTVYEAAIKG